MNTKYQSNIIFLLPLGYMFRLSREDDSIESKHVAQNSSS